MQLICDILIVLLQSARAAAATAEKLTSKLSESQRSQNDSMPIVDNLLDSEQSAV